MPIDKKAARAWRRQIRDILNDQWDPIGVSKQGVEDEYDAYVGKIAAMIRERATDEELIQYLKWAEVDHTGLGASYSPGRTKRVVAALRGLGLYH